MGEAKAIRVLPISSRDARKLVERYHYSRTYVNNSTLHLGVFLEEQCLGVMQFGSPLDRRKVIGLVADTKWNEMLELNRMAFSDNLPRNSESRALGYAFRFLRKNYPFIRWVLSFSDATRSGDGTIYRASGFVLTGIKVNTQVWGKDGAEPGSRTGVTAHLRGIKRQPFVTASVRPGIGSIKHAALTNGASSMAKWREAGYAPLVGYQLRYVRLLDSSAKLTVPVLPFSKIDELGARMHRGVRAGSAASGTPDIQSGGGGATPTPALHL